MCAKCEKPFLGHRHYERKGLAYCETHYNQVTLNSFGNIYVEHTDRNWNMLCYVLPVMKYLLIICKSSEQAQYKEMMGWLRGGGDLM